MNSQGDARWASPFFYGRSFRTTQRPLKGFETWLLIEQQGVVFVTLFLPINRYIALSAFTVMAVACLHTAAAQLRVVTHNTLVKPTTAAEQTLARTIYGAIAGRNANGIAKRPDLIGLQEQQTGMFATTDQMIMAL